MPSISKCNACSQLSFTLEPVAHHHNYHVPTIVYAETNVWGWHQNHHRCLFVCMAFTKSSDCNNSRTNLHNPLYQQQKHNQEETAELMMVTSNNRNTAGRICRTHSSLAQQQKHVLVSGTNCGIHIFMTID